MLGNLFKKKRKIIKRKYNTPKVTDTNHKAYKLFLERARANSRPDILKKDKLQSIMLVYVGSMDGTENATVTHNPNSLTELCKDFAQMIHEMGHDEYIKWIDEVVFPPAPGSEE